MLLQLQCVFVTVNLCVIFGVLCCWCGLVSKIMFICVVCFDYLTRKENFIYKRIIIIIIIIIISLCFWSCMCVCACVHTNHTYMY